MPRWERRSRCEAQPERLGRTGSIYHCFHDGGGHRGAGGRRHDEQGQASVPSTEQQLCRDSGDQDDRERIGQVGDRSKERRQHIGPMIDRPRQDLLIPADSAVGAAHIGKELGDEEDARGVDA